MKIEPDPNPPTRLQLLMVFRDACEKNEGGYWGPAGNSDPEKRTPNDTVRASVERDIADEYKRQRDRLLGIVKNLMFVIDGADFALFNDAEIRAVIAECETPDEAQSENKSA